jgi:flagellar biosynthesis anti-sigma factor FlgM
MSTEIQPTNLPLNIGSSKTSKSNSSDQSSASKTESAAPTASSAAMDKVSITDTVARLQGIESMLADIPAVDNKLVAQMSQAIADGSLNYDLEVTASKLIQMETGQVSKPEQQA